jgi:hypothetical protein
MGTKCYIIVCEAENLQGRKCHYNRQGVLTFKPAETKNFRFLTGWKHFYESPWWGYPSYNHKSIDIFVNRRVLPKIDPVKRFADVRRTHFDHPFIFLNRNCAEKVRLIIESHNDSKYDLIFHVLPLEIEKIEDFSNFFHDKVAS